MSLTQKVSVGISKRLASIKEAHAKRILAAEQRANRKMANARTKQAREMVKIQLQREKVALNQELYDAKISLNREKEKMEKARKASGGSGVGDKIGSFIARAGKATLKSYKELDRYQRKAARKTSKKLF